MIPSGDLFDMKATIATDKQRMIEAEYALLVSKMSLAQLLQLEDFKDFDIADVEYEFEPNTIFFESPEFIYYKARIERTEFKILKINLKFAEKTENIAKE